MKLKYYLGFLLLFMTFSFPAYSVDSDLSKLFDTGMVLGYSDEGLDDGDLTDNLEAENLPSDGIRYNLENMWFGLRRAFTFNSEKKAELDRERLHTLDRKLNACSEIGDEDCINKIEERLNKVTNLAQRHLEKREELKEKHLERFKSWREHG